MYEDGNVYIADKFSGVSFEGLLSELSGRGAFYGVHRLDRNTEGLIVFAHAVHLYVLSAQKRGKAKRALRIDAVCKVFQICIVSRLAAA